MNWSMIVLGCIGGLLPDVLRIVKDRYQRSWPDYWKYGPYWVGIALMVVIGGALAAFLDATAAKEALAYGFSGPEILTRLLAQAPPKSAVGGGERAKSLRAWWAV